MRFINFLLIVALMYVSGTSVKAQDCQVLLPAIAGKYTGDCKKGKADGKGTSIGTDQYVGEFKAGLPDGEGTYTWKNGNVFKGVWVKGVREGMGSMAYKREGKPDSVVNGAWKKDAYVGKFDKPYIIHQQSTYFSDINVRKYGKSSENSITFNTTSGSSGIGTQLSNVQVYKGAIGQTLDGASTAMGSSKRLMDVTFPIRLTANVGSEQIDLEIDEPGAWTVAFTINK
jgi:hypothetical protein